MRAEGLGEIAQRGIAVLHEVAQALPGRFLAVRIEVGTKGFVGPTPTIAEEVALDTRSVDADSDFGGLLALLSALLGIDLLDSSFDCVVVDELTDERIDVRAEPTGLAATPWDLNQQGGEQGVERFHRLGRVQLDGLAEFFIALDYAGLGRDSPGQVVRGSLVSRAGSVVQEPCELLRVLLMRQVDAAGDREHLKRDVETAALLFEIHPKEAKDDLGLGTISHYARTDLILSPTSIMSFRMTLPTSTWISSSLFDESASSARDPLRPRISASCCTSLRRPAAHRVNNSKRKRSASTETASWSGATAGIRM